MNNLVYLVYLLGSLVSESIWALDLSAYQLPDGAITVHRSGDAVDPYFAMKALWAARQLDDPAPIETRAWIKWMLPRQEEDGRFLRYCQRNGRWQACDGSDADDSSLALWLELLNEAAPRSMPARWALSTRRAERALENLLDKESGVYHVSPTTNVALLMDNAEIYAALKHIGELHNRAGDKVGGQKYLMQAKSLRLAMGRVFGSRGKDLLNWNNGDTSGEKFYPHRLAHIYPWLHDMDTSTFGTMLSWQVWLDRYADAWLARTDDPYPWGLVALVAYRRGSNEMVDHWLKNSSALREGENWNVLEDAILQGLARARLNGQGNE